MHNYPLLYLLDMSVIAFSYHRNQDLQQMPDILLDGQVLETSDASHKEALMRSLADNQSVIISSSKEYDAKTFADSLGIEYDDIKAKKVDLNDLHRALQIGKEPKEDAATAFYNRDRHAAEDRLSLVAAVKNKLGNYLVEHDQRLNSRQVEVAKEAKQALLDKAEHLGGIATSAKDILDGIQGKHVHIVNHAFQRMAHTTSPNSFQEHIAMINLNNEAQNGKQLFEIDYTQAQNVSHTLEKRLRDQTSHIASKYLGMQNGEINPQNRTELSDLALQHFPDLIMFGTNAEPELAFTRISNSDNLAELFRAKMPDGTSLINPGWFNDLKRSGANFDINDAHKDSSIAAKHLLNMQKPVGMHPVDANRLDFVKDMLHARRAFIDYDRNNKDLDKLLSIADDNDGKVPMALTYAGAISKRFTAGGDYNLNGLGMQEYSKSVLKAPDNGYIVDIDYSQAELAMAAALLNNQAILQAYNERTDIYLALGIQANQVTKGNPLPWSELVEETKRMQYGTPDEVKADKTSDYSVMRSAGKMVAIPAIYGIGAESLSKDQGITHQQATILLKAFDHVFPEIKKTQNNLQAYMLQHVGNPNAPVFQFGGVNNDMITINANDQDFTKRYAEPDVYQDFMLGTDSAQRWLMDSVGITQEMSKPAETTLTATLSNGERMVYFNPRIDNSTNRPKVIYEKRDSGVKELGGYSLLQNIVQFATFSATREMTVNMTNMLKQNGIDSKYLLNIHDETAILAKDERAMQQTVELLNSGAMSSSQLAPNINMAFSMDVGKNLAEVKDIVEYKPVEMSFEITHDEPSNKFQLPEVDSSKELSMAFEQMFLSPQNEQQYVNTAPQPSSINQNTDYDASLALN